MAGAVRIPIVSTFDSKGITQATSALGQFKKAFGQATTGLDKLSVIGDGFVAVGRGLTRSVTLPIVAIGAAAAKMAMDFEASFAQIQGLVGVSGNDLEKLRQAALELGPAYGKSAGEAANALFFITSAGMRGAEAIEVLEASLKASAVGLGDAATVADLATSAMNAYGADILSAAAATDVLTAAVREGKLEPSELGASMGQVLPVASAMGVEFHEVGAAFAAMSRTGTNASQAATQLRQILATLLKPTSGAEEALKGMGLSAEGLRTQLREDGLLSTLETLTAAFEENEAGAEAVFGNIRALSGVMDLMGSNVEGTRAIFDSMTDTTGMLNDAFDVTAQTAGFEMAQAMAEAKTAVMEFGVIVLPIVREIAGMLSELSASFRGLSPATQEMIVRGLAVAAMLGPLLLLIGKVIKGVVLLGKGFMLVKAAVVAVVAVLGAPISIILGIVAAVGILAYAIYKNWESIKQWTAGLVARVRENFAKMVADIRNIPNTLRSAIDRFKQLGRNLVAGLVDGVKAMAKRLVDAVRGVVSDAIDSAKKLLGISSPSKVFEGFGKDSVRGFIRGFEGMSPSMNATVQSGMAFSGPGGAGRSVTIAPGAIVVTVNASGRGQDVGAAVSASMDDAIARLARELAVS